jgi:aspartyl/asparaginyl-tRNA synthetase
MIEPEIAFADLDDLADLAEDFLKYVFKAVLEECPDDMAFFAKRIEPTAIERLERLIDAPFVRLDYAEAIEILKASGKKFEFKPEWGLDLQTEHERYLTENHFNAPVVVKWTYWHPESVKLLVVPNVKNGWMYCSVACRNREWMQKPIPGTSTCAAMAQYRTQASGSVSSG